MKVRITKITDDAFNGEHPQGINVGYVQEGVAYSLPTKGNRYCVGDNWWSTSMVTEELNSDNIFKTLYSTYKLEILEK